MLLSWKRGRYRMIFQNIDFHNVEEMELTDKGYKMWRLPKSVRDNINERAANVTSGYSTGVELRFKMKGETADIYLRANEQPEAHVVYIYYGSFQGGWQMSSKVIGTNETRLTIEAPKNIKRLKETTVEDALAFNPEVVRLVLPYGECFFIKAEGDIEPPAKEDLPSKTYLAYGSSITHGSLALAAPYSYPFRIAQKLNCDYINLGLAGTAFLEPEIAQYICSRTDWDFASLEMGINLINYMSEEEFEERVKSFISVMATEERPVFATSLFGTGQKREKEDMFRKIVRKYSENKFIFTDGLDLLSGARYISQDMVHPSLEGVEIIVDRWSEIMRQKLLLK